MRATQFVLSHYATIAAFAALAYLYGRQLTRGVSYDSAAERVGMCVALGLGIIAHLTLLLGLLGLLYRPVVLGALLAGAVLCFPILKDWGRAWGRLWRGLGSVWGTGVLGGAGVGLGVLVLLSPILALPLYPPTSFDATFYHLSLAKTYVREHGIALAPFMRFQVFPMINEMWFTLALLFSDDVTAHLFQLLTLCILTVLVYAFGRRHFSHRAGLWAAALVLATPHVLWSGSVAYIDISLVFFLTAAVYSFANWLEGSRTHWLVLSGVFGGFAAGAKYTALVFVGFMGLATLYRAARERSFRAPVIFSAVVAAVASPWYVRNYIHTRNPFFPFLAGLFGYTEWWSPEDLAGVLQDLRDAHGVGRGLGALFSLPYHLLFNPLTFLAEEPWSPIYIVALPLTAAWAFRDRKVRLLLALSLAYLLFWFYAAQIMRYLLPIVPFLSLATAASLDGLLRRLAPAARWANSRVLAAGVALLMSYTGLAYAVRHWEQHGAFPVTRAQRDAYLSMHLPSYPAYKLLNKLGKGKEVRLYSFHDENMDYFLDGKRMGDWFGPWRYARVRPTLPDGAALYAELKDMGVNYLLVNAARRPVSLPVDDEFFQEHFELLYDDGERTLYKLSGAEVTSAQSRQLLYNAGFETLEGEWPSMWGRAGQPLVDNSGENAKSGRVAVRCQGSDNTLFQSVPVKPGWEYLLNYVGRATEPNQTARLQVNWHDSASEFISTDIALCEVGSDWRRCAMTVTAPERATAGIVFASCHGQSAVWLDNYSFTEMAPQTALPGGN
jgi:hypothetical protein